MIFQAAFANFNPRAANKVDFHNGDRPPLLIIGTIRTTRSRPRSATRPRSAWASRRPWWTTRSSRGRPHFAGAPGWEAVADYALDWADRDTSETASSF
jgi:hypothetical protein